MKKLNCPTALSIAAIGLIFGAIGPWITVLGFINGGPTNSTEVGLIVFGGIGLVICSAFSGRFMRTVSILVGVLILIEAGHVFYEMHHANGSDIGSLVTPGWGLYLTVIACLWLIASTFVVKRTPMQHYNIASVRMANPTDTPHVTIYTGEDQPYERVGDR
jgi:hypothetical protein